MSTFDYQEIIDRIALVDLRISLWSGRAKLREEDIRLGSGGQLPPDQAASLGSKKIFDPQYLHPFDRIKKRAERYLGQQGVPCLGAWAVPVDQIDAISAQLDAYRDEFQQAEAELRAFYDDRFDEWVAQFAHDPDFQAALRAAKVPREALAGRFAFGYSVVRIQPADNPGDLQQQIEGLGDEMLADVAAEADEAYRRSFAGFGGDDRHYSQRALRPLKRIRDKVDKLHFLDPAAGPLVQAIDEVLARLPHKGKLAPAQIVEVVSLTQLLADKDRIRDLLARHGELVTPAEREAAHWGVTASREPPLLSADARVPPTDAGPAASPAGEASAVPEAPAQAEAAETQDEPAALADDGWF